MSEKHKHKDKKHKHEAGEDAKEAKRAKHEAIDGNEGKKDKKEKHEKKEKHKKDAKNEGLNQEKKDSQEALTTDSKSKEKNDDGKGNDVKKEDASAPPQESAFKSKWDAKPADELDKGNLKAWQDDELEVDSGDEANAGTMAARGDANAGEAAPESDTLDAFMADIKTEIQKKASEKPTVDTDQEKEAAEETKTISLEEVQALMSAAAPSQQPEATPVTGDPSAGSAKPGEQGRALTSVAHAPAEKPSADPDTDEDDKFHAAFIAEMKKMREEAEAPEFQPVATFQGAKPGYVFKKGQFGLGYYRDRPPGQRRGPPAAAARVQKKASAEEPVRKGSLVEGEPAEERPKTTGGGGNIFVPFYARKQKKLEEDVDDDEENEDDEDESKDGEEPQRANGERGEENEKPMGATGSNAQVAASGLQKPPEAKATPQESIDKEEGKQIAPATQKETGESSAIVARAVEDPTPSERPLTRKERRQKRKAAKEAGLDTKTAKKKAREGFGQNDDTAVMESDPDRSEESTEEEQESYFDLVGRFTTKKTLPAVDHSKIDYKPFRKNLYIQVKELSNMKDHEVEDFRRTHGEIRVRGKHCPVPIRSFLQCALPEKILKIFERRDYEQPFPIQMQAIPALMCGRDLIGVAQTGSGKTLAYLLPLIRHIMDQPPLVDGDGPIAFVVAPTRELALQIQREAAVLCKAVGLASVCAFGGGPMGEQLSALKKGAEVLVGTPGRLIDVLTTSNGKITNLRRVTFMVLDEADRMFDMGFEPQIGMFLQCTRPDKQVAMFSATLPTHVEALARQVLKKPLEIIVGERNTAATNVTQFVEVLEETQKFYRLLQLLGEWHEHGSVIIFVHQQRDVDEMFTELLKYGYPPLALHGGQDQHDRDFTLQDFKDGVSNILIATSVAARGIDVKSVILVINFKVPDHLEDYIHRIGRTGRAGKPGFAFTFIQPDEGDRAQDMVDAIRQCGQEVPETLKKLAEDHQVQVNTGQVQKRRRWGGFGGKGFKYDNSEKSQMQKDREKAKKDLLIGSDLKDEKDEFKDPWNEDTPMSKNNRGKQEKKEEEPASSAHPADTAAKAAAVAAKLQQEAEAKRAADGPAPLVNALPVPKVPTVAATMPKAPGPSTGLVIRKTEQEIEEQAQQMAEDALKSLDEEVKEKKMPALVQKLREKLRKAEQDQAAAALASGSRPPPPQPKAKAEPTCPVIKALPLVPGVLGANMAAQSSAMVSRSIENLQASMVSGAATAALAQQRADQMLGVGGPVSAPGAFVEEFEINDYPQIARQKISHRDPLLAIEELTGAKCWVRGQHFAPNAKMPEGARKLYVEITGPTSIAVQKGKNEVKKMMEALAIRTLNIPGMTNRTLGAPGKYDPAVGK